MTAADEEATLWTVRDMTGAYIELDHPADLFLEVRGADLRELFENALYAFYHHVTDLGSVVPEREIMLDVRGSSVEDALRELLSEALFRFETEGLLAATARVCVEREPFIRVQARLRGETAERGRHSLLAEVKAVTYHRLTATESPDGGWRATVLLDV